MKALVLASGGVDSTTCLGIAIDKYGKENVVALSMSYGQKHTKEMESAKAVADYYGMGLNCTLSIWRPFSSTATVPY